MCKEGNTRYANVSAVARTNCTSMLAVAVLGVQRENFLGLKAGTMSWCGTLLSSGTGARSSAEPHFFREWNRDVNFLLRRSVTCAGLWYPASSERKTNDSKPAPYITHLLLILTGSQEICKHPHNSESSPVSVDVIDILMLSSLDFFLDLFSNCIDINAFFV